MGAADRGGAAAGRQSECVGRLRRVPDEARKPAAGGAARPAGGARRDAGAARRGRARGVDPAAVRLVGHVARRALAGGACHALDRDEPDGRALQLGRGRRRPAPLSRLRERRPRRQPRQAGGERAIRCHHRVPHARRGAGDQDRAGREARRRRPAPGAQGDRADRAAAARGARNLADLAAAAPRHLLDRGPGAAHPRPQDREPARPGGREAGLRIGRGHRGRRRGQGIRRLRADRRPQRRHRGVTAFVHQARGLALGAGTGGGAGDAGTERAPPPGRGPYRRRAQDRAGRGHRGPARRRVVRLRHRAAGGDGLRHGAPVPPQHLPHRHRHPA